MSNYDSLHFVMIMKTLNKKGFVISYYHSKYNSVLFIHNHYIVLIFIILVAYTKLMILHFI
jgi:hypothetical protein